MHRTAKALLGDRLVFRPSLRFELFYALASLFDRTARAHPTWRAQARRDLPRSFWTLARDFGPARELWLAVPAALPHDAPLDEWAPLWAALASAEPRALAAAMLKGLLHAQSLVDEMLDVGSARVALQRGPRAERDWLRALGLVPYRKSAPLAVAIEALVRDPAAAIETLGRIVRRFWEGSFERTFRKAHAQYASVARGLEAYWRATSFTDLCASSLLRVRWRGDALEAIEGGYRVGLRDIERMIVSPSAFNERRYWSAVAGHRGTIIYLPTFEPSIEIAVPGEERPVLPTLSALADPSRWRMLQALLRAPCSASELAELCELSKATVSHHLSVLARAQLVTRAPRRGTVLLTVNRETILGLGDRILHAEA